MKSIKKSWMVLLTAMMPGLVTGMVLFLLLPVWNTTVCGDMTEADDSRLEEPEICYDTCEMFDAANKMLKKEIAPLFS